MRGLKERRHEAFGGPRVMQVLALSVICRLLWFRTTKAKLQDQVSVKLFVMVLSFHERMGSVVLCSSDSAW